MQCKQEYWTLDQTLILLRGVACQVSRSDPFFHVPSSTACRFLSGSYVHFVGSPAFLLTNMLATFCRLIWWRYVPKNHSLSRTIGPPNEGLTSHSFWIEFAAVSPFACTSDVRLLPWNELPVPLTKKVPA